MNGMAVTYGAFELKRSYQKNMGLGFALAASLHLAAIGSVLGYQYLKARAERNIKVIEITSLAQLAPPPSLVNVPPPVAVQQPKVQPPSVGIPKPVPDEEAAQDVTIASQEELAHLDSPFMGTGDSLVISVPPEEYMPRPDEFVPFEEQPQVIQKTEPKYPELARTSGVTGVVFVMMLVDKSGKVRDVKIAKSSGNPLLDDSAVEAVRTWLFKPAIQNKQPINCWTTVRIEFSTK